MNDFIKYEEANGVAIVTLNSPETRNTLSSETEFGGIEAVCKRIQLDRSIRAVVLTGAGKVFCAGGNIKAMLVRALDPSARPIDERYIYKDGIHRIPLSLYNLEVPVIAAINGPAIGAGLDLACMCDMRIASERATFAESFVKIGIIPGDGGAWLLQRIIGVSKAAELTFTGDTINASEALACGLVSKVVPPDQLLSEAVALAQRIAANPGHALRMAKRLMREAQWSRLETILEMSGAFQALAHSTDEHRDLIERAVKRLSESQT
ncbi:crotonase/enoyl-CoA hydratase family protein [Glaciimonas sp. PCH181]|uniref:crotonase/enoyl-CoA hydratase family protein n=1 Tax=Glaciimonas sp. PCH181 TaxID=2133943 RepID=UPI000D3CAA25|nr:crotonase/enoyl-CoA hydratase family protein [Glaciimonas sp. PCH181]PUA19493.1 enoyl-CoA hydratase [Glaciimonas sp. PCH181]